MAFKTSAVWLSLLTRMIAREKWKYNMFMSNVGNRRLLGGTNICVHINCLSVLSTYSKSCIGSTHKKMLCALYCCNTVNQSSMGLKYYSHNKKPFSKLKEIKKPTILHKVFQDKRQRLKQTELKLRKSGKMILEDIKETKTKMKEKMEEVIERENVATIPNVLCVTRIILSPYIGYLIIQTDFHQALAVIMFAGVTDLLDGWIARTFKNQSSKLGSFLDPMADKVLIATLFLSLTYADIMPALLTGLIIVRDLVLVAAGFYIRYQSLPPPRTLSRYFDVTHATAQLAPTQISKVNTLVQLATVVCTVAAPVFDFVDHSALHALWYITAGTTVASAVSYMLSKNTYRFLKDRKR